MQASFAGFLESFRSASAPVRSALALALALLFVALPHAQAETTKPYNVAVNAEVNQVSVFVTNATSGETSARYAVVISIGGHPLTYVSQAKLPYTFNFTYGQLDRANGRPKDGIYHMDVSVDDFDVDIPFTFKRPTPGNNTGPAITSTTLSYGLPSVAIPGLPRTISAQVETDNNVVPTAGQVEFTLNGVVLGTTPLGVNGIATIQTAPLPEGACVVIARYLGTEKFKASISTRLFFPVWEASSIPWRTYGVFANRLLLDAHTAWNAALDAQEKDSNAAFTKAFDLIERSYYQLSLAHLGEYDEKFMASPRQVDQALWLTVQNDMRLYFEAHATLRWLAAEAKGDTATGFAQWAAIMDLIGSPR